ncbi:MAG: type VI secretion system tube protein Hcp [Rubellimicrobium sp.]|nr:type VI secretion system tube protein Hcp [Rubellimicrobium sp.]
MALDMFLVMSNGIKGETKDAAFAALDGIDILAWNFGMSQSGTAHMGEGLGGGKVSVQDVAITKWVDLASPDLQLRCANGTHFEFAEITMRKAGGDNPVEYFKLRMENVLVSSYQTGGSGAEDRMTETLSLNFGKFKISYFPQNLDGSTGTEAPMTWDIAANKSE